MNDDALVLVGLGANLPSRFGAPVETLQKAVMRLTEEGAAVTRQSRFWKTRPVPVSDQPWFVNAVVAVETTLPPDGLLALLHRIEAEFGRIRSVVNAPRVLDLDLLAYGRAVSGAGALPEVPHPRLAGRAFVLLPIQDVAPAWRHPVSNEGVDRLIARLPPEQECAVMDEGA